MIGRGSASNLLLIGLLAAAIFLAGFRLASGAMESSHDPGFRANSPTTVQMDALLAKESFRSPVESKDSLLEPSAASGETAAVMAAETLLLNVNAFTVELPVVIK